MKKIITLFLMLFAFAAVSMAQCNLPNVNYNANQNRITINETDRGATYTFTWGPHSMTQKIGMFGGGRGQVVLSAVENTNPATVYLFGGLQDGMTITITKICTDGPHLLETIQDSNY